MSHQDWNQVKFTGPVSKSKRGEQGVQEAMRRGNQVEVVRRNAGNNRNRPGIDPRLLADEDSDVIPTPQLTHEFRMAMQRARVAAGLTQQELARRANEKQSVINEYEAGRAVPNQQVISKLERALGCRLPRPKK